MDSEAQDQFIESWGEMGSIWGISPSVARVHALLIVSSGPCCLDEIADRLQISKGNVSMSLKELRSWRVVHHVPVPGDRREFYVSEGDPWRMLIDILRERKKREFDPVFDSVRHTLKSLESQKGDPIVERLRRMEKMLDTLDRVGKKILSQKDSVHALATKLIGRL